MQSSKRADLRRPRRVISAPSLLVICLVLIVPRLAWSVPMLHLDIAGLGPNPTGLQPGVTVPVTVLASEIPTGSDGLGMFGFGFSVAAPSGVLLSVPTLGPIWNPVFSQTTGSPGASVVGATAVLFGESIGPSGDNIELATFMATPISPGAFVLNVLPFTGPGDNVLFDGTVLDQQPSSFFVSASLSVPEPSTLALLAFSLGLRRRYKCIHPSA